VGITRPGVWGRRVRVPSSAVHPVPDGLDDARAAACLSPALTAIATVDDISDVRSGERVAVIGATGVVGSICAALAVRRGARVIGVHSARPGRPAPAAPDGVELLAIDRSADTDVAAALGPVDAVLDTVGGPQLGRLIGALEPGGRLAVLGYTAGGRTDLDIMQLIARDVRVLAVNMRRRQPGPARVQEALHAVAAGDVPVAVEVVDCHDASAAQRTVDRLAGGSIRGRVVIDLTALATG
jgi:NADPH:quinone reductase-like Zn-dependent oxidoreductase